MTKNADQVTERIGVTDLDKTLAGQSLLAVPWWIDDHPRRGHSLQKLNEGLRALEVAGAEPVNSST
jgi:hypothetical protein